MPIGRIVLKSISESRKLSLLKTDGARLLYTWLIPHLDINGCYSGDAQVINGKIFTRLRKSKKTIEDYLLDLQKNNLIIRYERNGDQFLHVPDFKDKQPSLREEREAKSSIPLPTPDEVQSNSGVTLISPAQYKLSKDKLSKDKLKNIGTEPKKSVPAIITFSFDDRKFEGIQDRDKKEWGETYPAVDVDLEILKAKEWLLANPEKRKKNYRRFLVNWFNRTQERGGTRRGSGTDKGAFDPFEKNLRDAEKRLRRNRD